MVLEKKQITLFTLLQLNLWFYCMAKIIPFDDNVRHYNFLYKVEQVLAVYEPALAWKYLPTHTRCLEHIFSTCSEATYIVLFVIHITNIKTLPNLLDIEKTEEIYEFRKI